MLPIPKKKKQSRRQRTLTSLVVPNIISEDKSFIPDSDTIQKKIPCKVKNICCLKKNVMN